MAGKRRGTAEERWRELLRQWRGSQMSIRAFCSWKQVCEQSFYTWRKRLAQGGDSDQAANAPVLIPVQVVDSESTANSLTGYGPAGTVEILLPSGVRIHVGAEIGEVQLRSVLRAVVTETSGC